ncbi:ImmA/IrrE family metallo-endopeptidase [Corallococcus terminator]|uniref:ImmA/IrrE family metallo-endopeptidase n=1 Tax=Corallococcus terminator TaxID=2316733 RepID=A0A3A8JF96_9BACT|nr:ImmA/IrrE family metallo-endopeptidase [Corallococcus terminator]RKG90924.1 ImmA/IrrE family metallo-endopeptidase [Corallococcus terminator]
MTIPWLREALEQSGLPPPESFPRDLAFEAPLALPVSLEGLRGLTSEKVRQWLAKRGSNQEIAYHDMHGCMVARAGKGIVFFDEEDDANEQRFTIAHELGHFVLDHLQPRLRALRFFGETIQGVLDEKRPPTREEALTAALDGIPIGIQIHLMDRGPSGAIGTGRVAKSEQRADRLALEWLAPTKLARKIMRDGPVAEEELRLERYFGLPTSKAHAYARALRREEGRSRFSIASFFGDEQG